MALIGIPEAARRMKLTTDGCRRALQRAGVTLVRINERALAVDDKVLDAFMADRKRAGYAGRGRPVKERPVS